MYNYFIAIMIKKIGEATEINFVTNKFVYVTEHILSSVRKMWILSENECASDAWRA